MRWLDQVRSHAQQRPEAAAIGAAGQQIGYGDLQRGADGLAVRLRAAGLGTESLVAIALPNDAARLVAILGVLSSGAAYLPLGGRESLARQAAILRDAEPDLVLASPELATPLAEGAWRTWPISGLSDLPAANVSGPVGKPAPEDLAYVIYTSGSTGAPKGVEIEHGALARLIGWHHQEYQITAADRAALLAYPGFDAAVWELWPYWAAGASVHLPPAMVRLDAAALRDWLLAERITVAFAPTPLAEQLITMPWPERPPLRALLTGGDRLRLRPAGLPFPLFNHYGPTETTVVATHGRVGEAGDGLPAIGRPVPYLRIAIRDDAQRPLPAGAEGEIWIAGAALARGYRHEPGLTAERFRVLSSPGGRERSYRTGDRGRWRPDGELDFLGRGDRQVKIRGWRIEPAEIEQQLLGHPAVGAALIELAAGGGDTAVSEPRLTAFLVARNAEQPGLAALRAYLRTRLPEAMLPSEVRWLGQLPRTAQGKWDRAALALAASAAADAPTGLAAGVASDENPTARALAAILAEVLGVAKVGAEEDFFLLGGHSLLGVQLVARLREELGIVLPLRTIFDHPTAAQLAAEIDRRRAPAAAPDNPPPAAGDGRQGAAA